MNGFLMLGLVLAAVVCGGCAKPTAPDPAAADPGDPTQAQPPLRAMKVWLGSEELITELALAPQELRTGMMFRTNLAENAGMLFPLPYPQQASFWMKNCPLPLSAAYIDPEGVIQEIVELKPHDTNAVKSLSSNIQFVLEVNRGWFERHQIKPGAVVRTERGSLMATFFGKK